MPPPITHPCTNFEGKVTHPCTTVYEVRPIHVPRRTIFDHPYMYLLEKFTHEGTRIIIINLVHLEDPSGVQAQVYMLSCSGFGWAEFLVLINYIGLIEPPDAKVSEHLFTRPLHTFADILYPIDAIYELYTIRFTLIDIAEIYELYTIYINRHSWDALNASRSVTQHLFKRLLQLSVIDISFCKVCAIWTSSS